MGEYLSVEEAHIKTGQTCKLCNHQIKMERDESLPAGYFKQPGSGEGKSFVISKRIKYADHGLCHFHWKNKQGLFNSDHIYESIKEEYCRILRAIGVPAKRS
jgi:hypothetical protein